MDVFAFHNGQLIHCHYTGSTPQPVDFAVRAITVRLQKDEWGSFLTFVQEDNHLLLVP